MMDSQNPAECAFSETLWAGGQIRLRASCRPPEGTPVQVSIDGSFAAERFDAGVAMNMELPGFVEAGPVQPVRLQGRFTGRRTGNCPSQ